MTDTFIFGSGVTELPLARIGRELQEQTISAVDEKSIVPFKDLSADLRAIAADDWPVRNQHARGTCNAFAMVAAEELRRFLDTCTYEPLSEEYLYAKTRDQSLKRVPKPPTGAAKDRFERDGGTFLGQVMDALIEGSLADAKDAPYAPKKPLRPAPTGPEFSAAAVRSAEQRNVKETDLYHDIVEAKVGKGRQWRNDTARANLANYFVKQLMADKPVVAAFAILNEGAYVWTGHYARASGHVRYPVDGVIGRKRPVAGHSVCLVGYETNADDEDGTNPYTFLFRNSYGAHGFGRDVHRYPNRLNSDLPGYGIISARDVNWFCWEYLTYAVPENIEFLVGGRSPLNDPR